MKLIRKKYHLYKRFTKSKLYYDYQKYIEIRNKTKQTIRKTIKEYERKVAKSSKINPKGFWKYINTKLKRVTGIANLTKNDKTLSKSDKEKAEILNDFFCSVFTKEDLTNVPTLSPRNNDTFFTDIILTREAIKAKLNKLDASKASGPDNIPTIIFKSFSEEISLPLLLLFNKSLSEGQVPREWKTAEVTAIFKKGERNSPGNYRPVSLTCIACKVLESLITDQLRNYFEENKLFTTSQHGFRKSRSCVTQLLEVMNDLTNLNDSNVPTDIIYLDFRKAFDTVPHVRLINKLKAYGIEGNLLSWIYNFLTDRQQRVRVNTEYSDFSAVASGIPQGSILGPLLFIIFINDLPDNLQSTCKIFADDTKIYGPSQNSYTLQDDLEKLLKWSDSWQLHFNKSKCSVLHMGKNNSVKTYFTDPDKLHPLKETHQEKDVGVTFTNNLNFDVHINNAASKANQMVGLIRRSFNFLDKNMFLKLFKSIVRPHLEYANVVWHPVLQRQKILLEGVQRRATKMVPGLDNLHYKDRLVALKLPSIKYRQLRGDLIQTYKIIHEIDNVDSNNFFTFNNSSTRNSNLKLYKERSNTKIRANFLPFRINNFWNNLPNHVKCADNVNKFKELIDTIFEKEKYDFYE